MIPSLHAQQIPLVKTLSLAGPIEFHITLRPLPAAGVHELLPAPTAMQDSGVSVSCNVCLPITVSTVADHAR